MRFQSALPIILALGATTTLAAPFNPSDATRASGAVDPLATKTALKVATPLTTGTAEKAVAVPLTTATAKAPNATSKKVSKGPHRKHHLRPITISPLLRTLHELLHAVFTGDLTEATETIHETLADHGIILPEIPLVTDLTATLTTILQALLRGDIKTVLETVVETVEGDLETVGEILKDLLHGDIEGVLETVDDLLGLQDLLEGILVEKVPELEKAEKEE